MLHKDVKYTPLNSIRSPETKNYSKWFSPRRLFAFFFILVITLIGLLYTCFSHDTVCHNNNFHVKHTKRRLPQCLIIGARKAGTRALITYLRLHPDIQTAQYEVHFFDNPGNYDFGYEWYKKQMPYSFRDQITLEKTPAYFNVLTVPEKVYQMNSSIKLILIVRDPVQRSISDQLQLDIQRQNLGLKVNTMEESLRDKHGNLNIKYKPVSRSFYDIFMMNWLKFFPLEQFHFVDGDKMIKDPFTEVYKTESFLGVRHALTQDKFVFNTTKGFFCVKTDIKEKCLSESKGRKHPPVDKKLIRKLKDVFREHNENFFKLVNRTFDWNNNNHIPLQ